MKKRQVLSLLIFMLVLYGIGSFLVLMIQKPTTAGWKQPQIKKVINPC